MRTIRTISTDGIVELAPSATGCVVSTYAAGEQPARTMSLTWEQADALYVQLAEALFRRAMNGITTGAGDEACPETEPT